MQTSIVEYHLRFQDNIKLSYFLKVFRQRDLNALWAYYKTCVQFWREFSTTDDCGIYRGANKWQSLSHLLRQN